MHKSYALCLTIIAYLKKKNDFCSVVQNDSCRYYTLIYAH